MAYRWGEPGRSALWQRVAAGTDPTGVDVETHEDLEEARRSRRATPRARDIRPELRLIIGALDLAPEEPLG